MRNRNTGDSRRFVYPSAPRSSSLRYLIRFTFSLNALSLSLSVYMSLSDVGILVDRSPRVLPTHSVAPQRYPWWQQILISTEVEVDGLGDYMGWEWDCMGLEWLIESERIEAKPKFGWNANEQRKQTLTTTQQREERDKKKEITMEHVNRNRSL